VKTPKKYWKNGANFCNAPGKQRKEVDLEAACFFVCQGIVGNLGSEIRI